MRKLALLFCLLTGGLAFAEPEVVTNWHLHANYGVTVGPATTNLPGTIGYFSGSFMGATADGGYDYLLSENNDFDRALLINSPWITIGVPETEVWGVSSAVGYSGLNLGVNLGTRTNDGVACVNAGFVESSAVQATTSGGGGFNGGYLGAYSAQSAGPLSRGSINYGSLDGSAYWLGFGGQSLGDAHGCLNFGSVRTPQSHGSQSRGSFNFGETIGTNLAAGQTTVAAIGSGNLGHSGGSSAPYGLQHVHSTFGSFNIGSATTQIDGEGGTQQQHDTYGSFNLGFVKTGGAQSIYGQGSPGWYGHGSANLGYVTDSGAQGNYGNGAVNIGHAADGAQLVDNGSDGSLNLGFVLTDGQQVIASGDGVANIGYVYQGVQSHAGSLGAVNIGFIGNTTAVQSMSGRGSLNVGYLAAAGNYQTNTARGALAVGKDNVVAHNYSATIGDGVSSVETNSVAARKYHATQGYAVGGTAGVTFDHVFIDNGGVTQTVRYAGGIVTDVLTNGVSAVP